MSKKDPTRHSAKGVLRGLGQGGKKRELHAAAEHILRKNKVSTLYSVDILPHPNPIPSATLAINSTERTGSPLEMTALGHYLISYP